MAGKDFKTIDEQIEILRARGLTAVLPSKASAFAGAATQFPFFDWNQRFLHSEIVTN